MKIAVTIVFVCLAIIGLLASGLMVLGLQQPSRVMRGHDRVLFVALKHSDPNMAEAQTSLSNAALWRAKAAYPFIGTPELYWTDYLILPFENTQVDQLKADPSLDDVYVAVLRLSDVPALALGTLRAQHLLGLTQRPDGPLPESLEGMIERPDVMPSQASLEASIAADPSTQTTMLNYLQFYRDEAGQADAARREYRNKYGVQAVQAVHRVGGQFLFSGTIEQVTIAAKRQPSPVQWDDLAAMIYPDPTAIFYMEQHEPYRNALKHRDNSLERSDIVATVAY